MSSSGKRAPFAILTRGRTGSTFLVDALDQQPGIRCFQELLVTTCPICSLGIQFFEGSYSEGGACQCFVHVAGETSVAEWLDGVLARCTQHVTQRVGFKALARALEDWPDLRGVLTEKCDMVILTRNPFDEALSGGYANAIGKWNVRRSSAESLELRRLQQQPVRLDPSWVVDEVRYSAAWHTQARELTEQCRRPPLWIDFSDVTQGASGVDRVLAYLGGKPSLRIEDRLERNLADRAKQIENFDEICAAVRAAGMDAA